MASAMFPGYQPSLAMRKASRGKNVRAQQGEPRRTPANQPGASTQDAESIRLLRVSGVMDPRLESGHMRKGWIPE